MIRKNVKKVISIFVLTMFIMSALYCNVMASLSYEKNWGNVMPWTGDDNPLAEAVSSDNKTLSTTYSSSIGKYPIIESKPGIYGKEADDEIYKTYDSVSRTDITEEGAGFVANTRNSISPDTTSKDFVLSFSFAYDKAGGHVDYGEYANGLLVHSYTKYSAYDFSDSYMYNPIAIRKDGIRISGNDKGKTDLTGLKDDYFFDYNFESGKWYTVDFVFDFENKESSSEDNLQKEYKWSAYVNGTKLGESTVTIPVYQFTNGTFKWFPAMGAEMYWDNIGIYTIDDAAEFKSPDTSATLVSANDDIVISDGSINLNGFATVSDVKAAVEASLDENEEIRVYNSDYSAVLDDTESAFDTKLVVIGNRILNGETEPRETIYTYYDVNLDGYTFADPSITINGTTATGKVTLYNYSGEAQEFNVYLAVYKNGKLVALSASDNELVANEEDTVVKHTTPEVDLLAGDKAKLFVWNKNQITPELKATEKSYTIAGEYNPACADLKSITLPTAKYDGNYNEMGFLYPAFNKDVTEYDVYTYLSPYGQEPLSYFDLAFEAVNSDATVAKTTVPDTSLAETYAVYTVTSADGTVTKDYKINYHAIGMTDNALAITAFKNGLDDSTGSYTMWNDRLNSTQISGNILIQDGTFANGTRKTKSSRPIIEIDIENGPDKIDHGILTLTNTMNIGNKDSEYDSGILKVYKINDSIYSVEGGLAEIGDNATKNYFGDEMCSVGIGPLTAVRGDMYFISIDASYYNSLKAAGKNKMYLGLAGEAANGDTMALGAVFGGGGTGVNNSRFNYIVNNE